MFMPIFEKPVYLKPIIGDINLGWILSPAGQASIQAEYDALTPEEKANLEAIEEAETECYSILRNFQFAYNDANYEARKREDWDYETDLGCQLEEKYYNCRSVEDYLKLKEEIINQKAKYEN